MRDISPTEFITTAHTLEGFLCEFVERNSLTLVRDRWASLRLRRVVKIIVDRQECCKAAYNFIFDKVMANFLGVRGWRFEFRVIGAHLNSHKAILLRPLVLLSSFGYSLSVRVDSISNAVSQLDISQERQVGLHLLQITGVCNLEVRYIVDRILCFLSFLSIIQFFQLQCQSGDLVIKIAWMGRAHSDCSHIRRE